MDLEEKFKHQAKQFRALKRILITKGDSKALLTATICEELAEVAENLSKGARKVE